MVCLSGLMWASGVVVDGRRRGRKYCLAAWRRLTATRGLGFCSWGQPASHLVVFVRRLWRFAGWPQRGEGGWGRRRQSASACCLSGRCGGGLRGGGRGDTTTADLTGRAREVEKSSLGQPEIRRANPCTTRRAHCTQNRRPHRHTQLFGFVPRAAHRTFVHSLCVSVCKGGGLVVQFDQISPTNSTTMTTVMIMGAK